MVLQKKNFEVPAQFSFKPYCVKWRFADVEILEWTEEPRLRRFGEKSDDPEKTWLRVRIGADGMWGGLLGLYDPLPYYTVLINRTSVPPATLQAHEDCHSTPDVSGRTFEALVCQMPEFKESLWSLKPGDAERNAWLMRNAFENLEPDPEVGWDWSVLAFLNKWGIWELARGYSDDWASTPLRMLAPSAPSPENKPKPDFLLVMPHLFKAQQDAYRKALLPSSARTWLRSHPLSLGTAEEFPFFRVRESSCRGAIEATITIDHLSKIKFGICKRCRHVFEKQGKYKVSYCSRRCANAASVERFRERQRKASSKGG